jgi:hypothetical protein
MILFPPDSFEKCVEGWGCSVLAKQEQNSVFSLAAVVHAFNPSYVED